MNKISLQMYTLREFTKTPADLAKTLERLREIGFEWVQFTIPTTWDAHLTKRIFDDAGLRDDSVFCSCLDLEERTSEIIAQSDLFGTDFIRMDSIPGGLSGTAAGYKMFAHYLNEVGAAYKSAGKTLLYHFHAFEFIGLGSTTGIEILLSETDPEILQIIPDTHWIQSGGRDPERFLEKYRDRYQYMHAKDFAIGKMGATWEARPIKFAPVGEGNLDWNGILSACRSNNVLSYAIEQDDCYGRDPFDCVKSSFDFMMKMGVNE